MKKLFVLSLCLFYLICLTGCSNTVKIEFIIDGESKFVETNKGSTINDSIVPISNKEKPVALFYDESFSNIYNNEIINEDTKLYVRKFDGSIQFGAFCTLEEAYSNNLLTIENVQTINDNYNNKVKINDMDIITERKIKNDYLYKLLNSSNYDDGDITLSDIEIMGYYGSFNEYFILRLKDKKAQYPSVIDIINIDYIIFEYTGPNFVVWSEKEDIKNVISKEKTEQVISDEQIKNDYLLYRYSQGETYLTIENIQILNHYGQYGDIVIVRMNRGAYQVVTYIPFYDLNIQLVFGDRNTPLVYKNGVFFELYDAYEKGIITKEIVISLYEKINNERE